MTFKEIQQAWKLVHGIKWPIFKFTLVLMILPFITSELIEKDVPRYIDNYLLGLITISLSLTILGIITSYAILSMVLIGIRQIQHKSVSLQELKYDISKNEIVVFYLVGVSILFQIPFIDINPILVRSNTFDFLYIIISSFLNIPLYLFSMPFAIYKHQDFKSAFINGYKMLGRHWKDITCCLIVPNLIFMLFARSSIAINGPLYYWVLLLMMLFFIIIWIVPFFANIGGIIYRNAER